MSKPLVSVIIPVYNTEKYLCQCLDSVCGQTYAELEILLINDGSPDRSDEICLQYATMDKRINYIRKVNGGVSDTRNVGISRMTGEYVMFVDSDDYLALDCIERMIEKATDSIDLIICGYCLDLQKSRTIVTPDQWHGIYQTAGAYFEDFHRYFATKFNFAWGKLYRSELIRTNKLLFDVELSLAEDLLFNLCYYNNCKMQIAVLEYKGVYYRQIDSSTLSKKYDPSIFDWLERSFSDLKTFLEQHGAFYGENEAHFYKNYLGNYLYALQQYVLYAVGSCRSKIRFIDEIVQKNGIRTIFQDTNNLGRLNRLQLFMLRKSAFRLYYLTVKLRNCL